MPATFSLRVPSLAFQLTPAAWAAATCCTLCLTAQAQATPPSAERSLPTVTVNAGATAAGSSPGIPVTVLDSEALLLQRAATLGETLSKQPGVTASPFGAGANRPVIRGLDGARVKVLTGGTEVQDASTVGPDHAVSLEPLLAQEIEILRGPAALAYGSGVAGGVVNVLDNKIPTAVPAKGATGSLAWQGATAAREQALAFEVTGGKGQWAVHAEGVKRNSGDYRTGSGWSGGARVPGSGNDTGTASLGLAWIGERGTLGVAYTDQRSQYGLPGHAHELEGCSVVGNRLACEAHEEHAEEEDHHDPADVPQIDLRSQRWDLRGEWRDPLPGWTRMRLLAAHTNYRHDELEEGVVGTRFSNRSHDARLELEHARTAGWRGVLGLQTTRRDFSALGEEAYVQPTLTQRNAWFALEEWQSGNWRVEASLRHERQRIEAADDAFAPRHHGTSAALGATWRFAPSYSLALSYTHAKRLPTAEELFADGLHLATRSYERGNPALGAETSRNLEATLSKKAGATTFSVSAYRNRIANYIYASTLDAQDGLQLIDYAQRDARFTGLEGQLQHRLSASWQVSMWADWVRGQLEHAQGRADLPRIPARRLGLRLQTQGPAWQAQAEWIGVARQSRVADFETATPGYSVVNLAYTHRLQLGGQSWQLFARLDNVTNRLAYAHTSFVKDAAPLPGRNLVLGARLSF